MPKKTAPLTLHLVQRPNMIDLDLHKHITEVAQCPSFSSYEKRLHPYIRYIFESIPGYQEIKTKGNNLIFKNNHTRSKQTIALTCHIDKINHFGIEYPEILPVSTTNKHIKGAMDDSAGVGLCLAMAEKSINKDWPNLMFFFSEMEEKKGLEEHPERLKNNGDGYVHGMGARRISETCKEEGHMPDQIITIDTTPLFKGKPGIALYSKHWELNELNASQSLIKLTKNVVKKLKDISGNIILSNNTNDYLHYGYEFNSEDSEKDVVSIAVEPAIDPYHQLGERVFKKDIQRVNNLLFAYLDSI